MSTRIAPDDATSIYVVGKQWMWKFQHPEGQREINTLHVPVGRPIKLLLTSEDVIHSFFVPDFRIHMDVLPDRYTSVWFQADAAGHVSPVLLAVLRHQPRRHDRHGRRHGAGRLSSTGCNRHAEGSLALRGPQDVSQVPLPQLPQRRRERPRPGARGTVRQAGRTCATAAPCIADEDYLRESILDPGAKIVAGYENIMPTFRRPGQRGGDHRS